ncbi:MAG: DUF4492 domain-containing protein [Bacteroides sp.]|nr:DUF4492 domain-containing protein [Bacteroides sp.]
MTGLKRILDFYIEGFRSMTVGRKLWAIIIIKLILFFLVFKLFLFPDILERDYDTDEERADAVRNALIERTTSPTDNNNNTNP